MTKLNQPDYGATDKVLRGLGRALLVLFGGALDGMAKAEREYKEPEIDYGYINGSRDSGIPSSINSSHSHWAYYYPDLAAEDKRRWG